MQPHRAPRAQPDQPPPPLTLYLVKQVQTVVRAHLDAALRPHNLAAAQYTALTVLERREGLSSAQLARRSFVKAQTMHEMVVALERQGYIERRPSADRRHVLLIRLTAQGRRKLARARADIDRIERQMVRDLTPAELATLRDLLARCHRALSDPPPRGASPAPGRRTGAPPVSLTADHGS